MRAYHMNKRLWVSILIDKVTDFEEICSLIDGSFQLTDKKPKRKK
jgi:predicted DNA-binding protein (MmcQ/YjbR family)